MDEKNGWAFLIPFILLAVILLVYMVRHGGGQQFSRGVNIAPTDPVETPPELRIPKTDGVYDWAEEGDFERPAFIFAMPNTSDHGRATDPYPTVECEKGCPAWLFVGGTQAEAEALREQHYDEKHWQDFL